MNMRLLSSAALFFLVAACGDGTGADRPVATTLQAAGVTQHQGVVGTTLPDSIAVRVLDEKGRALSGVQIQFTVSAGGGSVAPATATTGTDGSARAAWTLGTAAGEQRVEARAEGIAAAAVTFTAASQAAPPASAVATGGDQTGVVGAALGQPVSVRLLDSFGNPVAGVAIAWSLPSGQGGSIMPAASTTDAAGTATATWTLGNRAGAQTLTATPALGPAVTITANSQAGPPVTATTSGVNQTGVVGSPLTQPLVVRFLDAFGNPAMGITVAWTLPSGQGGSITPATPPTDAPGTAAVNWTLGTKAGAQTVTATAAGGTPVIFAATAAARPASKLEKAGGDLATAPVGTVLSAPVAARVTDEFGNPIAAVGVTWAVTSGGGNITPIIATSDADGIARGTWTLGTRTGQNSATASALNTTVAFTATGAPGPVATLEKRQGDNQSSVSQSHYAPGPSCTGGVLPTSLTVLALDRFRNPVDGAVIEWTVGAGAISPARTTTSGAGEASATWTLDGRAGTQTARAAAPGGISAIFSATVTHGSASRIEKVSGDNQTGRVRQPLANPLIVRVTDGCTNPVPGATVSWGGPATNTQYSPPHSTTSTTGFASTIWTPESTGEVEAQAYIQAQFGPVYVPRFKATVTP